MKPKERRIRIIRKQLDELKFNLEDKYPTWVESNEYDLVVVAFQFLRNKKMLNSLGEKLVKEFEDWNETNSV